MKVCKRCNLEFDDKFKFCKKCGSILTDKVVRKKEFKIENTEGILVPSERHQIMIKLASKWFFLFFIFLILWILVINNSSFDSQSNSSVRTHNSLSLSTSRATPRRTWSACPGRAGIPGKCSGIPRSCRLSASASTIPITWWTAPISIPSSTPTAPIPRTSAPRRKRSPA